MNINEQIVALLEGELTQDVTISNLLHTLSTSPEKRALFLDQIALMNKYDHLVTNITPDITSIQNVWNRIDQYEQGINAESSSPHGTSGYFARLSINSYIMSTLIILFIGIIVGWFLNNIIDQTNQNPFIVQQSAYSELADSIAENKLQKENEQTSIHRRADKANTQSMQTLHTKTDQILSAGDENGKQEVSKSSSIPINVMFPNGGEVLSPGNKLPVIWNSHEMKAPVEINYSSDGGVNWTSAFSGSITDRYYWTIPNEIETSSTYLCRLAQYGQSQAQLVTMFDGFNGMNAVAISPDGGMLAAGEPGEDPRIVLWNLKTNEQVKELTGHRNSIILLRFNHDGSKLVSGSVDSTAIIWDVFEGTIEHILQGKRGRIWPAVYSPDGYTVATGNDDGSITLWNAMTGIDVDLFHPHSEAIRFLEYSSDGTRLIAASTDGTASIIDAVNGEVLQYFQHRLDSFSYLEYTNATTREEQREALYRNIVNGVQLLDDYSVIVTAGYNGIVKFWDIVTGKLIQSKTYHKYKEVSELQMSPDGKWMASIGYDGSAKIIDPITGAIALEIQTDSLPMIRSAFTPDSRHIGITHIDGRVTLWKLPLDNIDISDSFFTIQRCEDHTIE